MTYRRHLLDYSDLRIALRSVQHSDLFRVLALAELCSLQPPLGSILLLSTHPPLVLGWGVLVGGVLEVLTVGLLTGCPLL